GRVRRLWATTPRASATRSLSPARTGWKPSSRAVLASPPSQSGGSGGSSRRSRVSRPKRHVGRRHRAVNLSATGGAAGTTELWLASPANVVQSRPAGAAPQPPASRFNVLAAPPPPPPGGAGHLGQRLAYAAEHG